MTQYDASAKFFFTVRSDSQPGVFTAVSTMSGNARAFHSLKRKFSNVEEIERALTDAGVSPGQYKEKLGELGQNGETSFEVHQNEAQKLGILITDSEE